MALLLRKNFARGLLSAGINAVVTQLTVTAGHTLPTTAGNFKLVIWDQTTYSDPAGDPNLEIVTASYSGTPNVYDIVRAQENTVAVVHSLGDRTALHFTAGMSLDDLTNHTHAASGIDSGTFANARIAESNVTQHQAAIDHGSIAGLADDDHSQYHTDARAASWLAANHENTYAHSDIALNTTHRGLASGNPHSVTPTELSLVIGTDVLAQQTIGIADDNLVEMDDADAAANDYCKLTANGIVGREYSEVLGDLSGQATAAFDLNAQDLTNGGVIFLTEQAAAEASIEGKGQFWVLNQTPCLPMFTDDIGTDIPLYSRYVDRGDPDTIDWEVGDLITDNTWRDLDLGAKGVPANATAVYIRVAIQDDAVNSYMQFRKDGNTNAIAKSDIWTQVANSVMIGNMVVGVTNQTIEYKGSNLAFLIIQITVVGWWLA